MDGDAAVVHVPPVADCVDIVDPGMGYTPENPPYVTIKDACGDGSGAIGTPMIDDDGGIKNIIIEVTFYVHCSKHNQNGRSVFVEGPLTGDKEATAHIIREHFGLTRGSQQCTNE